MNTTIRKLHFKRINNNGKKDVQFYIKWKGNKLVLSTERQAYSGGINQEDKPIEIFKEGLHYFVLVDDIKVLLDISNELLYALVIHPHITLFNSNDASEMLRLKDKLIDTAKQLSIKKSKRNLLLRQNFSLAIHDIDNRIKQTRLK